MTVLVRQSGAVLRVRAGAVSAARVAAGPGVRAFDPDAPWPQGPRVLAHIDYETHPFQLATLDRRNLDTFCVPSPRASRVRPFSMWWPTSEPSAGSWRLPARSRPGSARRSTRLACIAARSSHGRCPGTRFGRSSRRSTFFSSASRRAGPGPVLSAPGLDSLHPVPRFVPGRAARHATSRTRNRRPYGGHPASPAGCGPLSRPVAPECATVITIHRSTFAEAAILLHLYRFILR